jgi:hypothetical protein
MWRQWRLMSLHTMYWNIILPSLHISTCMTDIVCKSLCGLFMEKRNSWSANLLNFVPQEFPNGLLALSIFDYHWHSCVLTHVDAVLRIDKYWWRINREGTERIRNSPERYFPSLPLSLFSRFSTSVPCWEDRHLKINFFPYYLKHDFVASSGWEWEQEVRSIAQESQL